MMSKLQVEALEERRRQTMLTSDAEALGALLHPSIVWIHGSSHQDSKASLLETISTGKAAIFLEIVREDVDIRIFNDTAVVSGLHRLRCLIAGSERRIVQRYMNVWCELDGAPQMVAWQSTTVPG